MMMIYTSSVKCILISDCLYTNGCVVYNNEIDRHSLHS